MCVCERMGVRIFTYVWGGVGAGVVNRVNMSMWQLFRFIHMNM